jgi:hypothetical protein
MFQKYKIARYGNKFVIGKRFFLFWLRPLKCKTEQEVDEYMAGRYIGGYTKFTGKSYLSFSNLQNARDEIQKLKLGQKPIRSITYRGKMITFIDR